jgi:hypothetical protein
MTITTEQLDAHKKWLQGDSSGRRLVLSDADLSNADLSNADLRGAVLRDAVLTNADLRGSVLRGADLRGAVLRGAALSGAYLRDAYLSGADLSGAIDISIAADAAERLRAVARAALQPNALEMGAWHTCETTHCMAGWAVHLAGEPGRLLEQVVGTEIAGLYLLGTEAHRHFYANNEEALEFLRGVLTDAA